MPCKSYYCTRGIRSYARRGSTDSRRPRTETPGPCLWLLQPACPAPGRCRCLGTAHEWWLGWQAAVHKALEKKERTEEQFVKLNIHSKRQLTCLGPFLRFLHAQHSSYRLVSLRELGMGGDFGECSPALLHHRWRGLSLAEWGGYPIFKMELRENQDAQFPKVHSPGHYRQQNPNEVANPSPQCPLQAPQCSSGWQADQEQRRHTKPRDWESQGSPSRS